jgi:hypothetical protein
MREFTGHFLGDHICRNQNIHGASMNVSICKDSVDFFGCSRRVIEIDLRMTDGAGHVFEDMEVSISESMMEKGFRSLQRRGRAANNVNNRDVFTVGTRDSIDCGKLSDAWIAQLERFQFQRTLTKCCDKSTQPFHSSITISGIRSIEFIAFN